MSGFDPNDFVVLYPVAYTEKEKALVEKYLADNRALEERGEIDVQALIEGRLPEDTPGLGPSYVASEAMIRDNNEKYDPENPIVNDAEYANKKGERLTLKADTIVTALPLLPKTELSKSLEGSAPEVHTIRDCPEPHLIVDAVADGSRMARAI